jgi:GxxExxY protein
MMRSEFIAKEIVDAAFTVHKELGPGLLESVYEVCLCEELLSRNLSIENQVPVPVIYKNKVLNAGFRMDILVEKKVIVELKAVDILLPVHTAQVITYLKLANLSLGFLINFNEQTVREGLKRIVYNYVPE